MRANVRPFVREYKSRAREAAPHSPKKWFVSGEGAQTLHAQHDNRATQLDRVQKEAVVVFRGREILASPLASMNQEQGGAQFTGRVLPCLLQEPAFSNIQNDEETSSSGRSRSFHLTKRRLPSRSKRSREMSSPADSRCAQPTLWSLSVSDEFLKLSDLEILSLMERAKGELLRRKEVGKEPVEASD